MTVYTQVLRRRHFRMSAPSTQSHKRQTLRHSDVYSAFRVQLHSAALTPDDEAERGTRAITAPTEA